MLSSFFLKYFVACLLASCTTTFTVHSNLFRHLLKVHKLVVEKPVKKPKSHHCTECSKSFASNGGLKTHCRKVHHLKSQRKPTVKCSIETCNFRCFSMQELVDYLNQQHEQGLEFVYIKFANEADFEKWQIRIERETPCRFNKDKTEVRKRGTTQKRTYYYCSRSGRSRL